MAISMNSPSLDLTQEPEETLRDVFMQGGLISSLVPDFEERPQQIEMALNVWRTLSAGGRLLVEAGTGVGKSLAYLVPAALWASQTGGRVVISTQTVNLQEQLATKDAPLVAKMFQSSGFTLEYSLFKGRSHYLCRRRWRDAYEETAKEASLVGSASADEKAVEALSDVMETGNWDGDRDTLSYPIADTLWAQVCSDGDHCMSAKCRYKDNCFYLAHRQHLNKCHIIIVNHALFAADLAVRTQTKGQSSLLPSYESIVFDEAHHLEDVVRDSLSSEVSESRLKRLADDTKRVIAMGSFAKAISKDGQDHMRTRLDSILSALAGALFKLGASMGNDNRSDKVRLTEEGLIGDKVAQDLQELADEIDSWADLDLSDEERFELQALKRRYKSMVQDLDSVDALDGDGDSFVYWAEKRPEQRHYKSPFVVKRSPLEVGPYLAEFLWPNLHSAVLTSATLATGGSFDYIEDMLSVGATKKIILGSPFDFRNQACFCVPQEGRNQDVNDRAYDDYLARKIVETVELASGRTFVLFTNRSSMEHVAELVRDKIEEQGYPFLKQGDLPKERLLSEFKRYGNAVLFGLDSFWEGVDVPGDALSCVILTKLPFPVPEDPVMKAREDLWKSQGLNAFTHYSLPVATLKLKQGFGRLIRTKTDRGAVVLLDPRIATKHYGKSILSSLPGARVTWDLQDVAAAVHPPMQQQSAPRL